MDRIKKTVYKPSETPIAHILRPVQRFMHEEASSGIVLFLAAVAALALANSPWSDAYNDVLHTHFEIGLGRWSLDHTLHFWLNEALMAVFFFVVGLEIKRAIMVGELRSPRKAALPLIAALGGMVAPAAVYFAFNTSGDGTRGWGIPMATDIAFSLGVLSLLRTRAPLPLKIFLTAFAIIDDIGAVLVIAVFYTSQIVWGDLAIAGGFLVLLIASNLSGVRHPLIYGALGTCVWWAFLESGVHATVAGVLVAATIPIRVRVDSESFVSRGRGLLTMFERSGDRGNEVQPTSDQRAVLHELEQTVQDVTSPLQRFESALHPWVAFVIMPLFALSNAGVRLEGDFLGALTHPVTLGVLLGLVVGKQVGVTLFSWVAIRLGIAALPQGVTWWQFYGVALLGGIGFTMSLFITELAFPGDMAAANAEAAKVGVLIGSAIAGAMGFGVLFRAGSAAPLEAAAEEE